MAETSNERIILPEKYYHTYFFGLIEFVKQHSAHLLSADDFAFIQSLEELDEDSQCLFIRFCNRKGPYFRSDKLVYSEIEDISGAISRLHEKGFISTSLHQDLRLLSLFTKQELTNIFPEYKESSTRKDELIESIQEIAFHQTLEEKYQIVRLEKEDEVEWFKLLYFGSYKRPMTEFVIRDVGHVKLEKLDDQSFSPWFQSRDEALAFFQLSKLLGFIRGALEVVLAYEIHLALCDLDLKAMIGWPSVQKIADKIGLLLGQELERENQFQVAIQYYELTNKPPSRERQVRIHHRLGRDDEAHELATVMLKDYRNATEKLFATDFLNRPKVRINRSTTSKLSGADEITVMKRSNIPVEQLALDHFDEQGFNGIHSENTIWKNLFGLVFWDEIYDQSTGGFHHPLQRGSSHLFDPTFYEKNKQSIQAKCKGLDQEIFNNLESLAIEKNGLANPMVYWYDEMMDHIRLMLDRLPKKGLASVLMEMSKNLRDNRTGFPDLFIWNENDYHFFEIKSPNDHLSSQQLFWIDFMQEKGIQVDLLRVQFTQSKMQ